MTPYELKLLIHFGGNPARFENDTTKKYIDARESLYERNIIEVSTEFESGYELTSKGIAWLNCILSTPEPTSAWIDKEGNVIYIKD